MELTRTQCHSIKGYAILLIVIHNFVDHLLGIQCNEMAYRQENTDAFLAGVASRDAVWQVLGFAGWIGVALFLFVSGYGLTRKYGDGPLQAGSFVKSHAVKLWRLLVPVYLLYFVLYHYVFMQDHNWPSAIAQLTFTINLLDYGDNRFLTEPGVYWFFGAIMQCYLLWLAIRRLDAKWLWAIAIASLVINYVTIYALSADASWWVRQNAIGWLAPFVLGMLAARSRWSPSRRVLALVCPLAFAALAAALTVKALAPLTEVFTVLAFIGLTSLYRGRLMARVGVISASLFVIHPLVRMICYNTMTGCTWPTWALVGLYLVAVFALSCLFSKIRSVFSF